jgi:hypothetical protein
MERENIAEWRNLEDSALKILRTGEPNASLRFIQLLIIPSFEPVIAYDVHDVSRKDHPKNYLARYTCWRRDIDAEKFRTPLERLKYPRPLKPTFESKSFSITSKAVVEILDRFRTVSIPTFINRSALGLDGTAYEVEIGDQLQGCRFHWWEEQPAEWQALRTAFQSTLQQLSKLSK